MSVGTVSHSMVSIRVRPGCAAAAAFRFGMLAAAVAGLVAVVALYWIGELAFIAAGYTLLVLFPVYLLIVASVLSVWLDYSKDAAALRPVTRRQNGPE